MNGEEHVSKIKFQTTLAGYIHWKLTGKKVLGVGEASGMFPIDMNTGNYNARMIQQFDEKIADRGFDWKLEEILPEVLTAGEGAGFLTEEGAKLVSSLMNNLQNTMAGGMGKGVKVSPEMQQMALRQPLSKILAQGGIDSESNVALNLDKALRRIKKNNEKV